VTTGLPLVVVTLAAVAVGSAGSSVSPTVAIAPPVVRLHEAAKVDVRGLASAAAVDVWLRGASMPSGSPLPWIHLRRMHRVWVGRLGRPALRGVYPVELRLRPGGARLVSDRWLLRVLPPGTLDRPSFEAPEEVASWWVANVAHGTLAAVRPWPLPANDRRDPELHRLFVVAYDPAGTTDAASRLGIWITAVRDGSGGRWRLLEATIQP